MVFVSENPIEMDDEQGYPYDLGNTQLGLEHAQVNNQVIHLHTGGFFLVAHL